MLRAPFCLQSWVTGGAPLSSAVRRHRGYETLQLYFARGFNRFLWLQD
jgi:hypothetical protein